MGRTTPSYLKGLRDERARADGDVARLTGIIERATLALQEALAARDSCDKLIRRFDSDLDPTRIKPNRGPGRVPGSRGPLRAAIIAYLAERASEPVTITELCLALEIQFGLEFETKRMRSEWQHNFVGKALKRLHREGFVERLYDPDHFTGAPGRWCWKAEIDPSPDHLRAQARLRV